MPTTASGVVQGQAGTQSATPVASVSPTALIQPAAAVAIATPDSATNAASGNAAALAGAADTSVRNTQLSAGVAGGGTGLLAVYNQHASGVLDSSAASAKSGVSVALVPTPAAGVTAATGVTTANSGDTSAVGITTSNSVDNTALQVVSVGGANQASVGLTSKSNVGVQNTGASGAKSGAAWAVAAGASGTPSGVATPSVAGAGPTSAAVSATGLQSQTSITAATNATVTVAGGPSSTGVISVAPTPLAASVVAGGLAAAASGAACSGAACPAQASTAGGATQASSGAANAQGLVAQNTVNTTANVAVKVAGQNFAPIQVVVESLTHIFNWGVASATSGGSTAARSGSTGGVPGQSASSGSAQATGAQVQNTVDLRSSAAVKVNGDNYNPINIMLNLAANLVNWGVGLSSSGDAQATGNGNGGGTASSGAAGATGLQVMNLVSMRADASVDIEGNNYAPIYILIRFNTNIDNRGYAAASSGNVAAGQAAPSTSGAIARTTPSSTGGGSVSKARGGDAVAISNSVNAGISSSQIAVANGGKPIASVAMTNMLRNLPAGSWSPFVQASLTDTVAPPVVNAVESTSGNATAIGLQSTIAQINGQIAACADPAVRCYAVNSASMSTTARDLARNPAVVDDNGNQAAGGTHATSEFAGVNATPTPTPVLASSNQSNGDEAPGADGSGGGGGGSSSSRRSSTYMQVNSRTVATGLPANGHLVLVDLWDQWPGRRLPPMPNPLTRTPITSALVDASLDAWPGADELPLPEPGVAAQAAAPSASAATGLSRRTVATASPDGPVDAGDDEESPLLAIQDVDPLGGWPGAEALPMPLQAMPSPAVAGEQVAGQDTTSLPPELGVTPVEFGLGAIVSAALGVLGGLSRGRGLVAAAIMRLAAYPLTVRRRFSGLWLGQQTARGLALLRLTLGILRLW